MRFPRKEHWSELPLPTSGDLSDPGIEPASDALAGGFFTTKSTGWEAHRKVTHVKKKKRERERERFRES